MTILIILLLSISALSEVHFLDEFSWKLFASLASRQSRNYYKLRFTGNKKITLEHGDVPDVAK